MPTINGKACVANGRNLIIQSALKGGYLDRDNGNMQPWGNADFNSDIYIPTNGSTVFTFSSPDYAFKGSHNHALAMYDSDKNYLGYQSITSATQTLSKSNVAYIRFSMNFTDEGGTAGELSDWLSAHRYKLEKGSVATSLTPAPVDKVFSNGKQVYGRNLLTGTGNPVQITGNGTVNNVFLTYKFGEKQFKDIVKSGMNVTLSFDWKVPAQGESGMALPQINMAPWIVGFPTINISDGSGHFSKSVAISDDTAASTADSITIRMDNVTTTITISKMKFEIGTIATPWSPAPEDVM